MLARISEMVYEVNVGATYLAPQSRMITQDSGLERKILTKFFHSYQV